MDEKLIIDSLVQSIKDGKFTIEQVPEQWREKVQEKVNEVK